MFNAIPLGYIPNERITPTGGPAGDHGILPPVPIIGEEAMDLPEQTIDDIQKMFMKLA